MSLCMLVQWQKIFCPLFVHAQNIWNGKMLISRKSYLHHWTNSCSCKQPGLHESRTVRFPMWIMPSPFNSYLVLFVVTGQEHMYRLNGLWVILTVHWWVSDRQKGCRLWSFISFAGLGFGWWRIGGRRQVKDGWGKQVEDWEKETGGGLRGGNRWRMGVGNR